YDLWGDTVNIASRMETTGVAGRIQVTPDVYERLHHRYNFEARGTVFVKGRGQMESYWLLGRKHPR
ncbi:MAG TPA: adenylate/guanylate cyclase domain-containing protein, partial [Candidatus Obscuribacterales bacterium]